MKYVLFIGLGVLIVVALALLLVGSLIGGLGGGSRRSDLTFGRQSEQIEGGPVIGTTASECNGPANARQYQALFAQAARTHLGDDQAMLLALIEQESGFNAKATNPKSTAAGMGQFTTDTARRYPEFVGGDDENGRVWPTGRVYERADTQTTPDDARFDPERSIFGAAHLLSRHLKIPAIGGDLYKAYFFGYHGGGNLKEKNPAAYEEGQRGATSLVNRYRRIRSQFC